MFISLIKKYRSIFLYLFFGISTTVINIYVYYICSAFINLSTLFSTCIAWVFAVSFAYCTNRIWVFQSNAHTVKKIIIEVYNFFLYRLLTGFLDIVIMYIFVDIFNINSIIIKTLSNILIIILNFIASKLIIFKKS